MSVPNYQSLAISLLKKNPTWLTKSDAELESLAQEAIPELNVTYRHVNLRRLTLALIRHRDELSKVGVPGPSLLRRRFGPKEDTVSAKDLIEERVKAYEESGPLNEIWTPFLSGNQPKVMYTAQLNLERSHGPTIYLCFDRSLELIGYNYFDTKVTYHPDSRAVDPSTLGIKKLKLNFS